MSVLSVLIATISYFSFSIQTSNHAITTISPFFSSSVFTVSATDSASPSSMQLLLQNQNIQSDNGYL